MSPLVVLTGFMGSGKSTVGQALAKSLAVEFIDTDVELERRAGRSIADIFVTDGEAAFRALEVDVVRDVLASHDGVIALGGGSVMNPVIAAALREHRVVYLDINAEPGFARVRDSDRPLLAGPDPAARYGELLATRRATYESVAAQVVDATAPVSALVSTIISALPDAGRYDVTPGAQV